MLCSLTIPRQKLKDVAALMSRVIERRNTIPVLAEVKVVANEDGSVSFEGTNLDTAPTITFPAGEIAVTGQAVFLLNFPLFNRLHRIPADHMTVTINGDGSVTYKAGQITITSKHMIPALDFPSTMVMDNAETDISAMTAADLGRLIRLAQHCISTEETRYYLNGLFFCRKPGEQSLRVVATDGHRLAAIDSSVVWRGREVIIPTPLVKLLAYLAAKDPEGDVMIKTHRERPHIQIHIGNVSVLAKLIDGNYPDYTRVLPAEYDDIDVTLTKAMLAPMAAALGETDRNRALEIDPVNGMLKANVYKELEVTCPIEATGSASIGFNLGYLCAQASVTPEFRLQSKSPNSPAHITSESEPDAAWVLMPMRV